MNWIIYALKDPRTDEIRYVGWTSQTAERRLVCHLYESRLSRGGKTYKARWVASLRSEGVKPVIEVLESGTGDGWSEAERRWIKALRQQGARLTNTSDGGEGNLGYHPPPEVCAKISRANKGRKAKRTPEHQAKLLASTRAANLGKPRSPEAIEASASKLRGRKRPPEVIAKWHAGLKGRVFTAETIVKMKEGQRRRWERDKHDSPETIKKKRAARLAYYEKLRKAA